MGKKNTGGKGQRKVGRNENVCKAYTAGGMQEKNKKRRMRRHILRNPDDKQARSLWSWGSVEDISVSRNGKVSGENITRRAYRKLARKVNATLQARLRSDRAARRAVRSVFSKKFEKSDQSQPLVPVVATG